MNTTIQYDILKEQIAKNEIKEVLSRMQQLIKSDSDLQNQFILHQRQSNRNKSDGCIGLISREVYLSEENQIKYNLLHMIEELWESESGQGEVGSDEFGQRIPQRTKK